MIPFLVLSATILAGVGVGSCLTWVVLYGMLKVGPKV